MRSEWRIVAWTAPAVVALVAMILALLGWNEASVRTVVRATARTSLFFFLLAFSGGALRAKRPSAATDWVSRNEGPWLASFAVSHGVHLAALIALALEFPEPFLREIGWTTIAGGGLGYALLGAMTLTSFERPRVSLGDLWTRRLHAAGYYYLWIVFVQFYLLATWKHALYLPVALLLLLALGLRLSYRRGRRAVEWAWPSGR